jgi:hypothetical protein
VLNRITRRLGVQYDEAVFLANRLELILGKRPEIFIVERFPELRNEKGEAPTVDQLFG